MSTHTSRAISAAALALLLAIGLGPAASAETADSSRDQATAPAVDIPNARIPLEGVLTGGQPSPEALEQAATAGYRTILNLRGAGEGDEGRDEAGEVEALGMRYVTLPIASAGDLDRERILSLKALLDDADARPMMIHCASGNRVGALLALVAAETGTPPDAALGLGLDAGLTRLEPVIRERLGLPAATPPAPER
ncbi:MAG: sulfur transferase domain-containing protein [Acidobacteriota bacterium]